VVYTNGVESRTVRKKVKYAIGCDKADGRRRKRRRRREE